jgi:hypothetical protein
MRIIALVLAALPYAIQGSRVNHRGSDRKLISREDERRAAFSGHKKALAMTLFTSKPSVYSSVGSRAVAGKTRLVARAPAASMTVSMPTRDTVGFVTPTKQSYLQAAREKLEREFMGGGGNNGGKIGGGYGGGSGAGKGHDGYGGDGEMKLRLLDSAEQARVLEKWTDQTRVYKMEADFNFGNPMIGEMHRHQMESLQALGSYKTSLMVGNDPDFILALCDTKGETLALAGARATWEPIDGKYINLNWFPDPNHFERPAPGLLVEHLLVHPSLLHEERSLSLKKSMTFALREFGAKIGRPIYMT